MVCFLQEWIASRLPALGYPLLGRKLRACRSHHYAPGSSPCKAWNRIHLLPVKLLSHILDMRLKCEVTIQCRRGVKDFFLLPSELFVCRFEQNKSIYFFVCVCDDEFIKSTPITCKIKGRQTLFIMKSVPAQTPLLSLRWVVSESRHLGAENMACAVKTPDFGWEAWNEVWSWAFFSNPLF